MRKPKVFVDSNIILSGTFFSGVESILLGLVGIDIITADVCLDEVLEVSKRKFKKFHVRTRRLALEEVRNSFVGLEAISEDKYEKKLEEASKLVNGEKDRKVLAAVLIIKPDYFVTGDKHFHTAKVKGKVDVFNTKKVLEDLGYN